MALVNKNCMIASIPVFLHLAIAILHAFGRIQSVVEPAP